LAENGLFVFCQSVVHYVTNKIKLTKISIKREMTQISEQQILNALSNIKDPDLGKDIVTLGFVKDLQINGSDVSFRLVLTTPACPVKESFEAEAHALVRESNDGRRSPERARRGKLSGTAGREKHYRRFERQRRSGKINRRGQSRGFARSGRRKSRFDGRRRLRTERADNARRRA
jgi:metal-sulfur cluster biosynthetic enzyme